MLAGCTESGFEPLIRVSSGTWTLEASVHTKELGETGSLSLKKNKGEENSGDYSNSVTVGRSIEKLGLGPAMSR